MRTEEIERNGITLGDRLDIDEPGCIETLRSPRKPSLPSGRAAIDAQDFRDDEVERGRATTWADARKCEGRLGTRRLRRFPEQRQERIWISTACTHFASPIIRMPVRSFSVGRARRADKHAYTRGMSEAVVPAVGTVITDDAGRVLLIKRANPPQKGRWTVPGGKVEPGETLAEAAARETLEETGLRVAIGAELWSLRSPTADGRTFDIHDFAATVIDGRLHAGDDAADIRWATPADLAALPLTTGLLDYLGRVGIVALDDGADPTGRPATTSPPPLRPTHTRPTHTRPTG